MAELVHHRIVVPTCVGCGAMAILGTCETGCREERLDLVRAAAHDELLATGAATRARADAFATVAERLLVADEPTDQAWQRRYEALQQGARAALRRFPPPGSATAEHAIAAPTEAATTWWCSRCGGLDAPQPCLGICVWRPVEWIERASYDRAREDVVDESDRESALRRLLRRLAGVTPRAGQWERTVRALQAEARRALQPEAHRALRAAR